MYVQFCLKNMTYKCNLNLLTCLNNLDGFFFFFAFLNDWTKEVGHDFIQIC